MATVLSAQTTDEQVNSVTPTLFRQYPAPEDLAAASPERVEEIIHPTGFFRVKTKNIIALASAVSSRFGGVVPTAMEDLVTLPGVGRKTANVVLSVGFGLPGLPVDTHVGRLSLLLGLTEADRPCEGRGRTVCHAPEPRVGPDEPPPDPARPACLHRPPATLRRMRAGGLLPSAFLPFVPVG